VDDETVLRHYLEKEIDIIQGIINRLAHDSFLVKGWAITLIVVTLLLQGSEEKVIVAFVPLIAFWILDSYYLQQERLYRELYKWVISKRLNTDEHLFDMNATRFKDKVHSIPQVMASITLLTFYGSIALLLLLLILYHVLFPSTPIVTP
jgi:hypothetical protein